MYQYKDKRLLNFFKMEINNAFMRSYYRRFMLGLCCLFLVFYFYTLTSGSNTSHIILADVLEPVQAAPKQVDPASSVILDTLVKEDGDGLELLPIHTLVSPYKNGMFLYNMEELTESWWTFECLETRMSDFKFNTKLCIHEPKFDNHISGQLKGNWLISRVDDHNLIKYSFQTLNHSIPLGEFHRLHPPFFLMKYIIILDIKA